MTTTTRNPGALLLAEDPEALRDLSAALRRRGFEVLTAQDGIRGVEVLLDALFSLDVVVVDHGLPGRGGAALLELVRVAGGERDLAVVLRAAGLSWHEEQRLRALGADDVVSPGVSADAAASAAAEAVARRSAPAAAPVALPAPAARLPFPPAFASLCRLALPAATAA
jgi:DNA-binding response OmpR family regulator